MKEPKEDMRLNPNFQYVIHFLKNAGERLRAIRLTVDVAGISIKEAKDWVDGLKWRPKETNVFEIRKSL